MKTVTFASICFALTACGASLSESGARVRLVTADPPAACSDLGSVSAYSIGPGFQDALKTKLRNQAAEKGANLVRLEQMTSDGNAGGTAFKCPEAATGG